MSVCNCYAQNEHSHQVASARLSIGKITLFCFDDVQVPLYLFYHGNQLQIKNQPQG